MKPIPKDVLKWAREAGFQDWAVYGRIERKEDCLNYFASIAYAAGAAAEREECAKECDRTQDESLTTIFYGASNEYREGRAMGANLCAIAIRARGEKND